MTLAAVTLSDPDTVVQSVSFTDLNYALNLQPNTINASLEIDRSRYGTATNPQFPSTVAQKWLWVFSDNLLSQTDFSRFWSLLTTRQDALNAETPPRYLTVVDNSRYTQLFGSASPSKNVRVLIDEEFISDIGFSAQGTAIVLSFSLIEI